MKIVFHWYIQRDVIKVIKNAHREICFEIMLATTLYLSAVSICFPQHTMTATDMNGCKHITQTLNLRVFVISCCLLKFCDRELDRNDVVILSKESN